MGDLYFWDGKNFIINANVIKKFNQQYNLESTRYAVDNVLLTEFVNKSIYKNAPFENIYHMVTLINAFYSTRMGADNCYEISQILHQDNNNIIDAVQQGDKQYVQTIVNKQLNQNGRVAFSFTTKYFSVLSRYCYNKDFFPIYDSIVAHMLDFYYRDKGKNLVSATHKNYIAYCKYIEGLNSGAQYKQLDTFLWTLGGMISKSMSKLSMAEYTEIMSKEPKQTAKMKNKIAKGKDVKFDIPINSNMTADAMALVLNKTFSKEK